MPHHNTSRMHTSTDIMQVGANKELPLPLITSPALLPEFRTFSDLGMNEFLYLLRCPLFNLTGAL